MGQLLLFEGDSDGALERFKKVLAEHPDYQKPLEAMMILHGTQREMDEFVSVARRLIEANPTHYEANFQLGRQAGGFSRTDHWC